MINTPVASAKVKNDESISMRYTKETRFIRFGNDLSGNGPTVEITNVANEPSNTSRQCASVPRRLDGEAPPSCGDS